MIESVVVNPSSPDLFSQSMDTIVWILQVGSIPLLVIAFAFWWSREEKPFDMNEEIPLEAELID